MTSAMNWALEVAQSAETDDTLMFIFVSIGDGIVQQCRDL